MSNAPEPRKSEPAKPAAEEAEPAKTAASKPSPDGSEDMNEANSTQPYKPVGVGPSTSGGSTPNRWTPAGGTPAPVAGRSGSAYTPPPPKRTSAQIRADIDNQREQLGGSVDALRDKVTEITDWRGQLKKHRKQIIVGAVATGFVVGGLMAMRRR